MSLKSQIRIYWRGAYFFITYGWHWRQ